MAGFQTEEKEGQVRPGEMNLLILLRTKFFYSLLFVSCSYPDTEVPFTTTAFLPFDALEFEASLIYDSLLVLSRTVGALNYGPAWTSVNISCANERPWEYGTTFFNYLNSVVVNGITGKVAFEVGDSLSDNWNLGL